MISVSEALAIIKSHVREFGIETLSLTDGLDRILKEDWYTDRDMPPYDRVTMDGIAIRHEDYANGCRSFRIAGVAAAGSVQQQLKTPKKCLEVMTGAVLPYHLDTVIRYEDLEINEGYAAIQVEGLKKGKNIHYQGEDRKQGSLIVRRNTKLSAAHIGVGATIGKAKIQVAKLPKVMVISTGDELVNINERPAEHQIRRSNVHRIVTSLKGLGIDAQESHLMDDKAEIRSKLKTYLTQYDALILSGGVSKGKFDYLPEVFDEIGVEKLFHKIAQRPGKPFWFGKYKRSTYVFALPGNPISSFLCMQRYFKYWLQLCLKGKPAEPVYAKLGSDIVFKPDLTYFLEVKLSSIPDGSLVAMPQRGNGSGDLANLVEADGFVQLPLGRSEYRAGEVFEVFEF